MKGNLSCTVKSGTIVRLDVGTLLYSFFWLVVPFTLAMCGGREG